MSELPQTPTAAAPRRDKSGRLVSGGGSLNPGGEPKWLADVKKELQAGSLDAARYLVRVAKGDEKFVNVYGKDCTEIELPVMPKDRIAAAKVVFEYVIPKPKQEAGGDDKKAKSILEDVPKAIVDELARLDS